MYPYGTQIPGLTNPMTYPTYPAYTQPAPTMRVPEVPGREGANAFRMGPNSSVFLADSTEDNGVWLKTTDALGTATLIKGHIVFDEDDAEGTSSNYVTLDRFEKLETKVDKVLEELNG